MAVTSSSPTRLHLSEPSSPIITRTPLPHALTKLAPAALPDSSPCVIPAPGLSTAKTPASAYARPSSPTAHKEAEYASSSSPTTISPNAYALRPAKRARLSPGLSPVTPARAPGAPVKAGAIKAAPGCGRGGSSAMAKRMSDAGCKMGSFKVHVGQPAKTPGGAGEARKKAPAAAKALPGPRATPSGGMKIAGFRHLSSATPIASRTVAKQPRVEETKMLSPSKRAHDESPAGEAAATATPASVGMAKVPSVLQPVPSGAKAEERGLSPVSCAKVGWTRQDDAAIVRFHGATQGDFVWIARALRPVRFADEVAQRYKQ